jgi:hypothetical protein
MKLENKSMFCKMWGHKFDSMSHYCVRGCGIDPIYEELEGYGNGEDGYYGPNKLRPLFDAGINPRCGKKL